MALNSIAVVSPRSESRSTEPQKKDWVDRLMEGLTIAKGITGITSDIGTIKGNNLRNQAAEDKQNAIFQADEAVKALESPNIRMAQPGESGAMNYKVRTGPNPEDLKDFPLIQAVKQNKDDLALVEYVNSKGQHVKEYVKPTLGASYQVFDKPQDESKPFDETTNLRKEYDSHPTTKATTQLITSFDKIDQAANNKKPTGASDIGLVYNFMRMQDPNSTVREGEFATAQNSGSVDQNVVAMYNKLLNGERLAPEQRKSFADAARSLLNTQLDIQSNQDARYADVAKTRNLKPEQIIDPTFNKYRQKLSKDQERQSLIGGIRSQVSGSGTAIASPGGQSPSLDDIDKLLHERAKAGDPLLQDWSRKSGGR